MCPAHLDRGSRETAALESVDNLLVLAGQAVRIKEVDDGIWLISFMEYDLGYIDLGIGILLLVRV
jgi:hypothetical protein